LRNRRLALGAILAAAFAGGLAALDSATAGERVTGYWMCKAGAWIMNGDPGYPMPTKPCGWKAEIPKDEPTCALKGGEWRRFGLSPRPICVMPARDAGNVCADNGECEGLCLADLGRDEFFNEGNRPPIETRGRCSKTVQVVGCIAPVEKGLVKHRLCID